MKLSLGVVVAADMRLIEGSILIDQSMLTGEFLPVEAASSTEAYAGALVRRGEAVAEVIATGIRTKFGRTAELVRAALAESSQQKTVLHVVRNLVLFNGAVTILLATYALWLAMPLSEIAPLILVAVLSSIPVALPSMFTLAAAVTASSTNAKTIAAMNTPARSQIGVASIRYPLTARRLTRARSVIEDTISHRPGSELQKCCRSRAT